MKVRITKVPDQVLNASKWHADGGLLQRLDKVYGGDKQAMLDIIRQVRQNKLAVGGPTKKDRGPVIYSPGISGQYWNPNNDQVPDVGMVVPYAGSSRSVVAPIEIPDNRAFAIHDVKRRLIELENSKKNPSGGWNEKERRWYPHKSHEKGSDTIAYGIKLSSGLPWAKLALKQGYLTDDQAMQALDEMSAWFYDKAKEVYDKKYGDGSWNKLNGKQQSILTDYEYNVSGGLKKFPSLMNAMYIGDVDLMLKESPRKSAGKPLVSRNSSIARDIDSLRTFYPVVNHSLSE